MAEARQTNITMQIQVEDAGFRSSGKRIDFPGFFRAYVEGSDDPDAAIEGQEVILPNLQVGDRPACTNLEAISHDGSIFPVSSAPMWKVRMILMRRSKDKK